MRINLPIPWVFAFSQFLLEGWPNGCCWGPRPEEAIHTAQREDNSADFGWNEKIKIKIENEISKDFKEDKKYHMGILVFMMDNLLFISCIT